MNNRPLLVGTLMLIHLACVGAGASNEVFDLSSPEKAIRSFFSAIQTGDVARAIPTISPRILWVLKMKGHPVEEYVNGWRKYPLKDVRNVQLHGEGYATADVVVLIDGIEDSYRIGMERTGDSWQWGTNAGFFEVEGGISFEVREEKPTAESSKKAPNILIFMKTMRQYGCFNFQIRSHVSIRENDITVDVFDMNDPGGCATAVGPARARHYINIEPGLYTLRFVHEKTQDTYSLVVTESEIEVRGNDGSYAVPSVGVHAPLTAGGAIFS